ncbi:diphthine--ammonia ligase [Bacteriovorax sp. Seq25_V]|uniref:Dph6-related ATP pyrophosphatase n=1 Tax=Bacteriovorax sp. Seq25_V TaxID=1201288 RepID=UPI00038A39C0|nr:diphthine--ammonia ligase [Bacteriovorax sp. Seq25_V]EQC45414.1 ATP-binding region [Bacteriovorax sp. Seq25_V]
MQGKTKVAIFWSGGKDSALSLRRILKDENYQVVTLITTLNRELNEVPFHGASEVLVTNQAKLLNLPLVRVYIPTDCSNKEYEEIFSKYFELLKRKGVEKIVFGDISQQEIRNYRDQLLDKCGLQGHYPLWGMSSEEVMAEYLQSGYRAIITAVREDLIDISFLGKELNLELLDRLRALEKSPDICGENGEYHSFVVYGPGFRNRVPYSKNVTTTQGPYTICKLREA